MNEEQQSAIDMALQGHNLFLLGSAGTGKSFVIKEIQKRLSETGNTVKITCSTGIACQVYSNFAIISTIHQFLGLGDGRYGPEEIVDVINNNRKYDYVATNLSSTNTLIVGD